MIHDSFTQEEIADYVAHHEPRYHRIRHTKSCIGCADAQAASNYDGQLCRECQREMERVEGSR